MRAARISACSAIVGIIGGGPGYPVGNKTFVLILRIIRSLSCVNAWFTKYGRRLHHVLLVWGIYFGQHDTYRSRKLRETAVRAVVVSIKAVAAYRSDVVKTSAMSPSNASQ